MIKSTISLEYAINVPIMKKRMKVILSTIYVYLSIF